MIKTYIINPVKTIGSGIGSGIKKTGSLAGRAVWTLLFPFRYASAKVAKLFHLATQVIDPLSQKIFKSKKEQQEQQRHPFLAVDSQHSGTFVVRTGKNKTMNLYNLDDVEQEKRSSFVFGDFGTFVFKDDGIEFDEAGTFVVKDDEIEFDEAGTFVVKDDGIEFDEAETFVVKDSSRSEESSSSSGSESSPRPGRRRNKQKAPGMFNSLKGKDREQVFWPTRTPLVRELLMAREEKREDFVLGKIIYDVNGQWKQAREGVYERAEQWRAKIANGAYQQTQSYDLYEGRQGMIQNEAYLQPMSGGSGGAYWVRDKKDTPLYVLKVQAEAGGAVFARKFFEPSGRTFDPFSNDKRSLSELNRYEARPLAHALNNFTARPSLPDEEGFVRPNIPAYREAFSEFLAYELSEKLFPDTGLVPGTTLHVFNSPEFFDYSIDPNDSEQRQAERARVCSVQQFVEALDFDQWMKDQGTYVEVEAAFGRLNQESVTRLAFLDLVIGMTDRHVGNMKVTPDEKLIGIDHGLAFPNRHKAYRFSLLQLEQTEHALSDELKKVAKSLDMEQLEPLLRNWNHNDDGVIDAMRERIELIQWCVQEKPEMTLQEMGCRILLLKKGAGVARRKFVSINDTDISKWGLGRK